jgi:hypothetical protein
MGQRMLGNVSAAMVMLCFVPKISQTMDPRDQIDGLHVMLSTPERPEVDYSKYLRGVVHDIVEVDALNVLVGCV